MIGAPNRIAKIDWISLVLYLSLMLIGWVMIYSAVYDEDHSNIFDLSQRYGKQLLWIVLALLLGFIVLLIDAKFFNALAIPIYILVMLMLVGVLLFGSTIAGSKSWFQIGGFAIQPAEFAKFATALALANYLGKLNRDMQKWQTQAIAFLIISLPALLILAQYDTGSAIVFGVFILVLYREGMSGAILVIGMIAAALFLITLYTDKYYVIIGLVVLFGLLLFFIKRNKSTILKLVSLLLIVSAFIFSVDYVFENVLEAHQKTRINVLLGLETDLMGAGYNVNQSKIAIGSGGLTGKGFLQGTQTKYNFVPEQSTDFIFCTVGEEYGFVGSTAVIVLYLMLFIRMILLAERQRSSFSRIYGYGITAVMFFHFAINIGMTIGLVPVIGIPLPFLSYGGSSLWAFSLMFFVFLKQDANRLNIL
ncbi:MAG: rod shape-determining protein RodA [Bacteroidetes bacterium]|nr:rod shape-determining protein RodA [Bacteroidota bacterium]MBU1578617.1 rod shape-determining protein RodA [Bacteroidota bacterium]MBU2558763.1 rod shape-determining protein RodA [Bacteroidota bacterium]